LLSTDKRIHQGDDKIPAHAVALDTVVPISLAELARYHVAVILPAASVMLRQPHPSLNSPEE